MGKYACWATVSCGYDMIPPFGGSRLCLNTRLDNSEVLVEAQQTAYITSASDSTWRTTINYHPCQMIFRHPDINWNYGWFGGWSQANPLFSWAAILFVVFSVCLMWPNQLLSSHWFLCYLASHVSVKAVKHLVHLKRSQGLAFLGCLGECCSKFAFAQLPHISPTAAFWKSLNVETLAREPTQTNRGATNWNAKLVLCAAGSHNGRISLQSNVIVDLGATLRQKSSSLLQVLFKLCIFWLFCISWLFLNERRKIFSFFFKQIQYMNVHEHFPNSQKFPNIFSLAKGAAPCTVRITVWDRIEAHKRTSIRVLSLTPGWALPK